jgi:hypothetical protein
MPVVELRGNIDLRKALRNFAPDLEKELKMELHKALRPVVRQAKSFVPAVSPMRGWAGRSYSEGKFPTYNAATVTAGITYSVSASKPNKNGFTSMARIINKSAVGAIYETSGRKNPNGQQWVGPKAGGYSKGVSRSNNPNAGKQFINNLPPLVSSLKGRGRLIYRAWAENKGLAEGVAMRAIDSARQQFYARSKTTTFSKAA